MAFEPDEPRGLIDAYDRWKGEHPGETYPALEEAIARGLTPREWFVEHFGHIFSTLGDG